MKLTPARRWIATAVSLFALAGATTFAACGGGDDDEDEPTAVATIEDREEDTPEASGEVESVTVNQSFWHAGWKVTIGEATFSSEEEAVSIDAEFENLGADTATFDSQLVLAAGGENYESPTLDQDLPNVPGNLKGKGAITFQVADASFSFDDATLIVGNPANNQAIVPIGPEGDDLVSLEPRDIVVSGDVVAGALTLTVEGVEVRADLPEKHSIVEKGKKAVIVRFSARPAAGIQIGQGVLQSDAVALKLPDGTAVAVRSDGVSGVNELLQGKEGTTIPDLSVRFEADDPVEGEYAFVLDGAYGPGGARVTGELVFTIPPATDAAGTPSAGANTTPVASGTP